MKNNGHNRTDVFWQNEHGRRKDTGCSATLQAIQDARAALRRENAEAERRQREKQLRATRPVSEAACWFFGLMLAATWLLIMLRLMTM